MLYDRRSFNKSSLTVFVLFVSATSATAAELKLLAPVSMQAAIGEIVAGYEKSSGNKVNVELATVATITKRLQEGEAADVAIISDQQNVDLQKQSKITAGSAAPVARVGYGMFVKKGAPKPDISTVDAFKKTLLAAKSIGYGDPNQGGPIGTYMSGLIERLGLTADLKTKTRLTRPGESFKLLSSGEIELYFVVTTDISSPAAVDADLVGALPEQVQSYTLFSAGLVSASKDANAGRGLVAALTSADAKAVLSAKGFEPW